MSMYFYLCKYFKNISFTIELLYFIGPIDIPVCGMTEQSGAGRSREEQGGAGRGGAVGGWV